MFEEYVVGSHMSFKRNPNWRKTTIINGVEYPLPFLDRIVAPIIPDEATQIANLRTGKMDYYYLVPNMYFDHLDETEIVSSKYTEAKGYGVILKCTEPPFDDINVRQAMMIGTDMKAFGDLLDVGPLPLHWTPLWPGHPETIFTPLEDLPAETRLLYDYNPELAIQMLADAGYPDGFTIDYSTFTMPLNLDQAALLKYQWDKIGVEVEIKALDLSAFEMAEGKGKEEKPFKGALYAEPATGNPDTLFRYGGTGGMENAGQWSDPYFDELGVKIRAANEAGDYAEQDRLTKEAAVVFLNAAFSIPWNPMMNGIYWWPWLKNYYGETNLADQDFYIPLAHAWIDQDLKVEMGY